MSITEHRTVTSEGAKRSITKAFAKKRPIFLWGPMGIGKSELAQGLVDSGELGNALLIDLEWHLWNLQTLKVSLFIIKTQVQWIGLRQLICLIKN